MSRMCLSRMYLDRRLLAASTRRYGPFVNTEIFALIHRAFSLITVLFFEVFLFRPATLPAILPVHNQKLETKSIDLQTRLEANAQIAIIHLVLVSIAVEEAEMARDGKQKVIVEGRQLR